MHAVAIDTRRGTITVRPLRGGDTETVQRVFDRLGAHSRRLRFGLAKNALTPDELRQLARMDGRHHVLVAYANSEPVGIAHLVREEHDRRVAEVAYAVADDWQGAGVGTALAKLLVADASAAGITHLRAIVQLENRASLSLMGKATTIVSRRIEGGEVDVIGLTA